MLGLNNTIFYFVVIPPYIFIILIWAKKTNSVNCVQKQLIFLKTREVLEKQIIYLKSAKMGDSSGILFTFIDIKIKKLNIFFFLYFFPILMIFKNSLIKIFYSRIPISRYQICYGLAKRKEMRAIPKLGVIYLRIDFSIVTNLYQEAPF